MQRLGLSHPRETTFIALRSPVSTDAFYHPAQAFLRLALQTAHGVTIPPPSPHGRHLKWERETEIGGTRLDLSLRLNSPGYFE